MSVAQARAFSIDAVQRRRLCRSRKAHLRLERNSAIRTLAGLVPFPGVFVALVEVGSAHFRREAVVGGGAKGPPKRVGRDGPPPPGAPHAPPSRVPALLRAHRFATGRGPEPAADLIERRPVVARPQARSALIERRLKMRRAHLVRFSAALSTCSAMR